MPGTVGLCVVGCKERLAPAIGEGREPESDIAQAAHTMAVRGAIERSAAGGAVADVEDAG